MVEDFGQLTNTQLLQLIARDPRNERAWREFIDRFHKDVCRTIYYQYKTLGAATDSSKVEDMAQEVYVRLLKNNCQALKSFRSEHEHAILKYLQKTAISVVHTDHQTWKAKKRQPPGGKVSLDALIEMGIPPANPVDPPPVEDVQKEISLCLDRIFRGSRHAVRDRLIMKFRIFEGFKPDEIASHMNFKISLKRIANIIAEVIPELRQCLRERGISG